MTFTAYVIEKDGRFWSRTRSRWLESPADGCTFTSREEAEALAATSGWEAEVSRQEVHPKTRRVYNFGRDIEASPPGIVREIQLIVKGS